MLEVIATKVAEEAAKSAVGMLHEALKRENAHLVNLHTLYAKSASENISLSTLKEIRRALEV